MMSDSCLIESGHLTAERRPDDQVAVGKHILFFGDPMCSWCWGFAPELKQLAQYAQDKARFHIVMGGLRPGTTAPWDKEMRDYIRHHWHEVHKRTGQPFDFARFDDETFVYDTEPGARALVTVRALYPEKPLAMYEALQRAFYAENQDITDPEVLADLAAQCGVERAEFSHHFATPEMRRQVWQDYERTRAFGIQGFPAVVCAENGQYGVMTLGYRPYSAMQEDFEAWLDA